MHAVAEKLNALKGELNNTFFEREAEIHALILAVLSGEHVALIGPPGTSKSLLVRSLVHQITGAGYFEQLLSKTRPAEAVFGPLDIKEFRDNGNYVLKREGFATEAEFLFLDEAFKMSPVLGHDMLALLNERVRHEVSNGNSVHPVPLSSAFIASNELPTEDADDAAALWDRVLIRVVVDYLQESASFVQLLTSDMTPPTTEIAWAELQPAIVEEVPAVTLSEATVEALVGLRTALRREQINPSDRRFRQSVRALQANAFLNGRSEVALTDIEVLQHTLWDTPQQIEKVERLCLIASNPYYEPVMKLKDMVGELNQGMDDRMDDTAHVKGEYAREVKHKLSAARDQFKTLQMQAQGDVPEADEFFKMIDRVMVRALVDMLNQDPDRAAEGLPSIWKDNG